MKNLRTKEIEAALYRHDDVVESADVGSPDPIYGEVPVAYVVLRTGSTLTIDDLLGLWLPASMRRAQSASRWLDRNPCSPLPRGQG